MFTSQSLPTSSQHSFPLAKNQEVIQNTGLDKGLLSSCLDTLAPSMKVKVTALLGTSKNKGFEEKEREKKREN